MVLSQESGSLCILNLPFECQFKLSSTPEQSKRAASTWTSTGWWINADVHGNLNAYNIGGLEGDDEGAEVKKVRFELGQTNLLTNKKVAHLAADRSGKSLVLGLVDLQQPEGGDSQSNRYTIFIMELVSDGVGSIDLSYLDEVTVLLTDENERVTHLDASIQLINGSFLVNCFTNEGRLMSHLVNSAGKPKLILSEPLVEGTVTRVIPTGNSLAVSVIPKESECTENLFFLHLDPKYSIKL